jgi:hypothetical protein
MRDMNSIVSRVPRWMAALFRTTSEETPDSGEFGTLHPLKIARQAFRIRVTALQAVLSEY